MVRTVPPPRATATELSLDPMGARFSPHTGLGAHMLSLPGLWVWVLLLLVCCIVPYWCFQKHWLPHCIGKWVGRIYFRPCLPCTILSNKREFSGRWWAYVDDGSMDMGSTAEGGRPHSPPVLLGQAPLFNSQLRELETLGVSAIVNMCDEFMGPAETYRKRGISLLWLRTVDHLEPTVPAMRTAVAFIEHHRKRGAVRAPPTPTLLGVSAGRGTRH